MSQKFRDCGGKSIYKSNGDSCNIPSNLYDQKNQVDSIFEYMSQRFDNLSGVQGVQGVQGGLGSQGVQGISGVSGNGVQGLQGIQGPSGEGSGAGGTTVSNVESSLIKTATPVTNLDEVNPTNIVYDGSGSQDERVEYVGIGFDVEIFGITYDTVDIWSNGYITFGGNGSSEYDQGSYNNWIDAVPYPGVFIGAYDYSVQQITQSDLTGSPGQQVSTIRFQGSQAYANTDPNLSDIFWEITFHEDEPSKIYLNIIQFNKTGLQEEVDLFTFISTGVQDEYVIFNSDEGNQYELNLGIVYTTLDYTGSKISFSTPGTVVSKNIPLDTVEIYVGVDYLIKSDTSSIINSSQVLNVVSLSQADYDNINSPSSDTLYVIVD